MASQHFSVADEEHNQHTYHPSPANFEEFLPWACSQLQLWFTPVIKRIEENTNSGHSTNTKRRKGKIKEKDSEDLGGSTSVKFSDTELNEIVFIYAIYDNYKNLVQLKFLKNFDVPNVLIKLISLAVPFHPRLTAIYINHGLKQKAMYELWKLLNLSKVTEVTLDDTRLIQGNYYILLDENSPLRYLSLARCNINDTVVEKMAYRLTCPLSAGRNLSALNLTSNRITDIGAKYLGNALKVNRTLSYLNLSGNMITDIGAENILDSLQEFSLSFDDIMDVKRQHFNYLKKKDALIQRIMCEVHLNEIEKKDFKKKLQKYTVDISPRKFKTLELSSQSSVPLKDKTSFDRVQTIVETSIGAFEHAFRLNNIFTRDGIVYCFGNNILSYINLAYNNLTYLSVKKINNVLYKQEQLNRKPKGVIQICIDGNNIPEYCDELSEMEQIIISSITTSRKVSTVIKKKN